MKKTVNVNIGSVGYTIDEDAYQLLKRYLQDIRSRLSDIEASEVIDDVESRISDIFNENISFNNQVIGIELVRRAMNVIGHAENFGDPLGGPSEYFDTDNTSTPKLYRSRSQRVLAGVCGGIAQYLNIDVTLVRVIAFVMLVFVGMSLWVYIIMWIVVPQQPLQLNYFNKRRNEHR